MLLTTTRASSLVIGPRAVEKHAYLEGRFFGPPSLSPLPPPLSPLPDTPHSHLGYHGSVGTLKRALFIAAIALAALVVVDATQVMQRPAEYKDSPNKFSVDKNAKTKVVHKRAGEKTSVAYFTNWGIYGANFQPSDINTATLTHILYSFADVSPDTGTISLTDSYADEQKHYDGDSWSESGNNLYGCLKQMYLIKLAHRNIKVLLSVGGWTYSQSGHFNFVTDASKRATFVSSAVSMVENYGFDGIDIDFEYPSATDLASGFASLLTELRTAFNTLQSQKGDSCCPAGSVNYSWLKMATMDAALNYWNLMAYDYAGSWLTFTDNQANLYGGARTNVSTDKAIKYYIANGASASKINMGIPLYGRAFESTTGIGASYNGIGPGTIEAGVYSYSALPIAGATVIENLTDVSSYSYDAAKQELVSYDSPHIATIKAQYVQSNGLAGSMFWELSQDKGDAASSLVSTVVGVYGALDSTKNHISYPNSKWDNVRSNMGQGGGSSSTTATSTSTGGSTPTTTTAGTTPTKGACTVSAWSATTTYVGGNQASYNGDLWTAKWWTLGDTPGGSAGVWTDNGPC
ncbi:glycosyl hydrolases family 18-domain-containing protein [Epithele typhae]|uniref:glycosyl hydrolases family 18-domain-containing protein n=1 Tax=Epithele typhae TaxID=378194 RepID=UPI002008BBF1|nr:glycosyl hydrolases family 18-domain-containing protein [Epithele typhae]KAH9919452.1 glycosyl hydrolases family 18-domain-containing protein [Epithele typhae]